LTSASTKSLKCSITFTFRRVTARWTTAAVETTPPTLWGRRRRRGSRGRGDLLHLEDPSALGDVGLDDIDDPEGEEGRELRGPVEALAVAIGARCPGGPPGALEVVRPAGSSIHAGA